MLNVYIMNRHIQCSLQMIEKKQYKHDLFMAVATVSVTLRCTSLVG